MEHSNSVEILTWADVDALINHLLPQLSGPYDALVMVTRGGIVPGGIISEALDIRDVLTAAVAFPPAGQQPEARLAWPAFLQFPSEEQIAGRRVLVVDDIWDSGRTITAVRARIESQGGFPELAVLHYKPGRALLNGPGPDYYAAITNAWIVYPWEIWRRDDLVPLPPDSLQ
ncbi:MAG: phosphoribosyltransferase [Anaerolineae bacterium]|nr:phosphoribosyltransferase [Anaerolineae bacterium]